MQWPVATHLMRHCKYTIILTILSGFFGCNNPNKDFVFDEFKTQIEKEGMKIDSIDETDLIYILKGEVTLEVSLDNLRKNYERDKDKTHISDLVKTLVDYSIDVPTNWNDAKENIFISLYPNDFDFKDFVNAKVTDKTNKIYLHSENDRFTWISIVDLEKWNITESDLENQALKNADRILEESEIKFDTIENRKLGMLESEYTNLKSALLLAPTMKEKVKADFGYPFYAVIPVRDFCYLFSEEDFKFFSKRIGPVVVDEFKKSGYPITTEILKFSDDGINQFGFYKVIE
ncbi:hypothetical protein [uncultured Dokdonia sp.]|uniref:hypothetical protein n=1 Tax=Dokdonia sp. R78006 TaxID=3093866 RepID=UPI00262E89A0|nr:hypothetical protein [uncultured Dokdonia sp.]